MTAPTFKETLPEPRDEATTCSEPGGTLEQPAEVQTTLTLLGSWALWHEGAQVAATMTEQRLIVLLALRERQRRPYVAGMLWADTSEQQALRRLRNTLWSLRRRCPGLLETSEDAVALGSTVVVDTHELEATARGLIDGHDADEPLEGPLTQLTKPAELLPGWYEDWVLRERERVNELRIRALEALIDRLLLRGRHGEASVAAIAAIQADPLRESSHRALMRVYLAEGNPALAARQVDRYREILSSELGVMEPTAAMLELAALAGGPARPKTAPRHARKDGTVSPPARLRRFPG